jgi:hypothetical protein
VAACKDVLAFLDSVAAGHPSATFSSADVAELAQRRLLQTLTAAQFADLAQQAQAMASTLEAIELDGAEHARLAETVEKEDRKTHSIFFRLEGSDHRQAELAQEEKDRQALGQVDADMQARTQAYADLTAKKALLEASLPYGSGYIALTGVGQAAARDLRLRLYRASDMPFAAYWDQSQQITQELNDVAGQAANYARALVQALPKVDKDNLWAVAIGLAKSGGEPNARLQGFLDSYDAAGTITKNDENRLMTAEIVAASGRPAAEALPFLEQLQKFAASAHVPSESSAGVAAILYLGRRMDGSFPNDRLPPFLALTRSYESAALLAIVNAPYPDLAGKFQLARQRFQSWGYEPSEDLELSSAYLTVSDLPLEGVGTKISIIARGLSTYLRYPLVGASILASIPVLEANETLGLLEEAGDVLGRLTGPIDPAQLVCLAIRLLHGVKIPGLSELDPTAPPPPVSVAYGMRPPIFFVPIIVAHGTYYSTYSGIGGAHPGHMHAAGGFVG